MSEELKRTIETGLKAVQDQMQVKMGEYNTELAKSTGQVRTDLTGEIEKLSESFKSLQNELADLAQKQAAPFAAGGAISAGQEFIKSDDFKSLVDRQREKVRFEVKNTVVADGTTTFADQRPGIIAGSFAPLTLRQLIPTIAVTSNAVNSLRELVWTNDAAEVAQGAAKPESDITFAPYNVVIETVAHWIKVSNQLLADAPAVAAYIDTRLRDGLAQRIDKQLLLGDGASPNLSGLTDAGNFTAFTATSGANLAESINKAKYNRWAVGEVVDTAVVNPADWAALEILREGAGTGAYLFGAPGTAGNMSPFGVQIVLSANMPAGSFLVGSLRGAATIYQRQGAVVEMGFVGDDFTKNLVTIRAEERLGLAVDRPAAIMYGAITAE